MPNAADFVPLAALVRLFGVMLAAGMLLTIPLFKFDLRRFVGSSLFIKIIFWLPIFLIFIVVLYVDNISRLALFIVLLACALREIIRAAGKKNNRRLLAVYYAVFAVALLHLLLITTTYRSDAINLLIVICLASVLADVTAFFMGNYLGFHKLPQALNNRKSWEGVLGQIVGALAGTLLVNRFVEPVISIWLFAPIGFGAAAGDLANSFVKRRVGLKDWSQAIPGHGGFIDRLSSLAGSVAFTFYFLKFFGLS